MKAMHYQNFVNKMDDVFQTYAEKTAIVDYVSEEIVNRYSYEALFEYTMRIKMTLARQNVITKERVAVLTKLPHIVRCFFWHFPIWATSQCCLTYHFPWRSAAAF